jgi:REP element-mobilizing transposase RayT
MPYDSVAHHRRSTRLRTEDYTAGAFFVTIFTHERTCIFGEIDGSVMQLSDHGRIAADEWLRSGEMRPGLLLDAFIVMPNHLHGIVILDPAHDAGGLGERSGYADGQQDRSHQKAEISTPKRAERSLGSFVAGYKSAVTASIDAARATPGAPVWQRGYYEHVIRNDGDLDRIREYIANNPARWQLDRENPQNRA